MDIRSEKYMQVKPMITAAAWDLSRKYPNLTFEDAMGDCNLQFAKKIDDFDPKKGALTTYTSQIIRATRSSVNDRFCSQRGIPRARRSKKALDESHLEFCKALDNAKQFETGTEEYNLLDSVGFNDPEYRLFIEARNWPEEERDLLNALYVGTEQGIEATEASISRNFPKWKKGQAKTCLASLKTRVCEAIAG